MKWRYYYLDESDKSAKKHVLANVTHCATDRTLTKKLLGRFRGASGPLILIAMEGLELDRVTDYSHAAYYFGHGLQETLAGQSIPMGDRPIDGLILFVKEYLEAWDGAMVVVENWIAKRSDPCMSDESMALRLKQSHIAFFDDEVYHVLRRGDVDPELMEDTIREPWHHWFTGICASEVSIPESGVWSAGFIDELVSRTEYIFVPALDDEGFVIWRPAKE